MTANLFLHKSPTTAPAPVATTVTHMAGMLWYQMLSEMNASGMSDDTLGTGGSDFQSMFLWTLAQNDFGKYDSKLNAAAVAQLAGGSAAAASPAPVSAAPQMVQARAAVLAAAPVAPAVNDAAPVVGASAPVPAQALERAKNYAQKLWPQISAAAQALGVSPVAILAQSALETGWGAAAAGNNYFGIKASPGQSGTARPTHELVDGVLRAQTASFRDYDSAAASVADYVGVIKAGFPAAMGQGSVAGFAKNLQDNGYATDQSYAAKIVGIAQSPMMRDVLESLPGAQSAGAGQTLAAASE